MVRCEHLQQVDFWMTFKRISFEFSLLLSKKYTMFHFLHLIMKENLGSLTYWVSLYEVHCFIFILWYANFCTQLYNLLCFVC